MVDAGELQAKRDEYAGQLARVQREIDDLARTAMQLQGAIAAMDELLAPDLADVLPEGAEIDDDDDSAG